MFFFFSARNKVLKQTHLKSCCSKKTKKIKSFIIRFFLLVLRHPEENDSSPPPDVLEELYSRSLVPRICIPQGSGAPIYGRETIDVGGRILEWCEPVPGPVGSYEFMGFCLSNIRREFGINVNDHTGWMAEVHTRDGIVWLASFTRSPMGPTIA